MESLVQVVSMRDYFRLCVQHSFEDLGLGGETEIATPYLTDLLVRFAEADHVTPPGADGAPLVSVADRLAEIQRVWALDGPLFDPAREIEISRQLGDYTLFMSGFFWERVRDMAASRHYTRVGRRAYRVVAEHHRAAGSEDALVFRALSERFIRYAGVLTYMREVYVGANFAPWPHRLFARIITE
ncbi:MAG: hypothetical protein HYR86_10650 [Candidatus Rokubacteria bacterium]|nr:hypothetical protein [Candidatus Rokubacteria bacterium]